MKRILLELLTWQDVEEIILAEEEVLSTAPTDSYPTLESYYSEVLKRVRGDVEVKIPLVERYETVLDAAQRAVGKTMCEGRSSDDVLIRIFTAYRLRCEGYSFHAIGRVMHRDHSTVVHYVRKRMDDMLSIPRIFEKELRMYSRMCEML